MKAKKPCNYYDYQRLTLKNHFQYFGSLFPCRDKSIYLTLKSKIINSLERLIRKVKDDIYPTRHYF